MRLPASAARTFHGTHTSTKLMHADLILSCHVPCSSADGLMPGLAAFVMPDQVLAVCGCTAGQGNEANASTTSPAPPGVPPAPQSAASASATAGATAGTPAGAPGGAPAGAPAGPAAAPGQSQAATVVPTTPAASRPGPGNTPGSAIVRQVLPSTPSQAGQAPGKPAGTPGVPGGGNHPGRGPGGG